MKRVLPQIRFRAGPRVVLALAIVAVAGSVLHAMLAGPASGVTLRAGMPIVIGLAVAIAGAAISRLVRMALGRALTKPEGEGDAVDRT